MPAPSGSKMSKDAQALYGQKLGPDGTAYVDLIFTKVEAAWKKWQDGMTWGGSMVSGAGVGAWSGAGAGGNIIAAAPFALGPISFKANAPQQVKFTQGLASALASKFNAFPPTFKFTMINFIGASGATPITPGPVTANSIAAPLSTAGSGQAPSGIADLWKGTLTPPDFDFSNPNAKSEELLKAIAKTIEQSFQTVWLLSTMAQGVTVTTVGAPGGVVAGFMAPTSGKLM